MSYICLCLTSLHLEWWSLGLSLLLQMALFHSFLWLSSIPCVCVCVHTTSLSIHLSVDIQVTAMSWLLLTVLLWTFVCMYFFRLSFCLLIGPEVGLLGHMAALFLVFWGTSAVFSIVAASVYIPTSGIGAFPFLHTLSESQTIGIVLTTKCHWHKSLRPLWAGAILFQNFKQKCVCFLVLTITNKAMNICVQVSICFHFYLRVEWLDNGRYVYI